MTQSLPNLLTAFRLVAAPLVVWAVLVDDGQDGPLRWWALFGFLVASATDFLDGYFARRWEVITPFGKLADPIADKALVLGILATLCVVDGVAWWPVILLALREIAITLGRLSVRRTVVIPAGKGGKLKTVLQIAAITFYLVPHGPAWLDATAWWCLIAAVLVAWFSGVRYGIQIVRAARSAREPSGVPRDDARVE